MKRIILYILLCSHFLIYGQKKETKFFDDLYLGIKGGISYVEGDVNGLSNVFKDGKYDQNTKDRIDLFYGVQINKQFTPFLNLGFEFNKGQLSGSNTEYLVHARSSYTNYHINSKLMLNRLFNKRLKARKVLAYIEGGIGIINSKGKVFRLVETGYEYNLEPLTSYNHKFLFSSSLGFGTSIKLNQSTDIDFGLRKYFVAFDKIDGLHKNVFSNSHDRLFHFNIGLNKHLARKKKRSLKWDKVDALIAYSNKTKPKTSKTKKTVLRLAGTKTIISPDGTKTVISHGNVPLTITPQRANHKESIDSIFVLPINTQKETQKRKHIGYINPILINRPNPLDIVNDNTKLIKFKNWYSKTPLVISRNYIDNKPIKYITSTFIINKLIPSKLRYHTFFIPKYIETVKMKPIGSIKIKNNLEAIKRSENLSFTIEKVNQIASIENRPIKVLKYSVSSNNGSKLINMSHINTNTLIIEEHEEIELIYSELISLVYKKDNLQKELVEIYDFNEDEEILLLGKTNIPSNIDEHLKTPKKHDKYTLILIEKINQAEEIDYEEALKLQKSNIVKAQEDIKPFVLSETDTFISKLKKYEYPKPQEKQDRHKILGKSDSRKETLSTTNEIQKDKYRSDTTEELLNNTNIIHQSTLLYSSKQITPNNKQNAVIKQISNMARLNKNTTIEIVLKHRKSKKINQCLKYIVEIFEVQNMIDKYRIRVKLDSNLSENRYVIYLIQNDQQ
ncbi:MAG: hypothetical protein ACPG6V_12340 [Flavobacteriales bacterium]